jgi:hypothetical protein
MNQEEIHASLDAMLTNPKTKNFLNHLVRSYIPTTNIEKVWETPKGDFKCVLTKEPLFSTQYILEGIHTEEFKQTFMDSLKSMFDDNVEQKTAMANLIGDKKMGVTGNGTTTYMSYEAAQEFYNWVITKSLKGDKHINWLLGNIRRESFIKRAETIDDSVVRDKVNKMTSQKSHRSSFALGDASDALMKLKAKMEANEN